MSCNTPCRKPSQHSDNTRRWTNFKKSTGGMADSRDRLSVESENKTWTMNSKIQKKWIGVLKTPVSSGGRGVITVIDIYQCEGERRDDRRIRSIFRIGGCCLQRWQGKPRSVALLIQGTDSNEQDLSATTLQQFFSS